MSLWKTSSNETTSPLQAQSRHSQDLTQPRKHARRLISPAANRQSSSSSASANLANTDSVDTSNNHNHTERRKFRDAVGERPKVSQNTLSRRDPRASDPSKPTSRRIVGLPALHVEADEFDEEEEGTDDVHSTKTSSTTYAGGASGNERVSDKESSSSSDASKSGRRSFDWDSARKRNLALNHKSHLAAQHQESTFLKLERSNSVELKRRSFGSYDNNALSTPQLKKKELEPDQCSNGVTSTGHVSRQTSSNLKKASPTPTGTEATAGAGTRRAVKLQKKEWIASSSLETIMLLAACIFACHRLSESEDEAVYRHVYELAFILCSSALYCLFRIDRENGAIWATDERNYRPCGDDGAICGLLLGPLLAVCCLFTSLEDQNKTRPASGDSLIFPPWRIEAPLPILGSRNTPHPKFSALILSRCSLLSLQTLTSATLLCHLLATKWIKKPSDFPKSNWKKLWSFIKFSAVISLFLTLIREVFMNTSIPIWTDLTRSEVVVSTLFFQCNLYTISRLARKSFTLGELGIVATVGVTLCIEAINLTMAKLTPGSTPYVKTFRRPTPLLIFQLALVVGTFMIGFLLSPLLYLSRNLAQKPVHRLRWPHKRDMHRRLLAGFFYFFAALFVVLVLGNWVWWLLGKRNPWLWTVHFVVGGKRWWSRPLLVTYWFALVSLSISGWQATVLGGKRFRFRPAGTSLQAQQRSAAQRLSAHDAKDVNFSNTVNGAAAATPSSGATTFAFSKKAAHLSLNARRKFFHALAVLLFTPAIAYDPAFSHLAFSVAFSAFIMAEYIRYYAVYPFGAALHVFMSEFTDHKDSGPVILSHFYLLTGCASIVWIEGVRSGSSGAAESPSHSIWNLRGMSSTGQESSQSNVDISMFIGVLTLGIGDALASVVGRRYGKVHWPKSSKTMEGSVAFVTSIFASALFLRAIGWCAPFPLIRFGAVTVILGILEGASNQNDNLVLPVFAFIALSLFKV
ncbi:hypothetical protein CBS101457_006103 [Exobasidium rhododendri]|nr:hypothetical protein CBS101457_006103 [Exobasidium rhododendri]